MLQKLPDRSPEQLELHPTSERRCSNSAHRAGSTSAPAKLAETIARQIELLLLEPGYFLMERGMLRGIRKRAEDAGPPVS